MVDAIVLTIPEEISNRARQIADDTARPVEQVLLDHLKKLSAPLPPLPLDEQDELDALKHLSDDALWTMAAEQMPESVQNRMQILMDRNTSGEITDDEYHELEALVERGNRLMVRKAEASVLLVQRGHTFTQQDFQQKRE